MANNLALGLVIGGAVSSTVGSAFKDVEGRIKRLDAVGAKSRVLQRTIGDTMRLRQEWQKAHASGAAGADGLRRKLEANLEGLKRQGVEVKNLGKAYQQMGRLARSAELKSKGQAQLQQGGAGLRKIGTGVAVGAAALALPAKVSADYNAIIRDIAIKAGIANKPQEGEVSRKIIETSRDSGMARNDVADLVNALVGAGMDLTKAMEYAPVAAKFAVGQGADGTDTAKMINALGQNAKITDAGQMQKALESIAYQGQAGSFEATDMAKWFPELLAGMGKLGITGNDSVAQLGAMLQVQMKTAGSSDEAANNLKNWMEKIGSSDVVKSYADAGIDYQKSMNTGLQAGKSTLETSFALAQKYIEKTDPAKAKAMAESMAKISKETDPAKAKEMMASLEQALRTGDLFADAQVKAALTAYTQNKDLYQQLKKDSQGASGILDKNLGERRDTSSQKWKEAGQGTDDAMRSVGDALAPLTDRLATSIITVTKTISGLAEESPKVVAGVVALGGGIAAAASLFSSFKIMKGLLNIGRGVLGGGSGDVQKVEIVNPGAAGDEAGGAGKQGKASIAAALIKTGLDAYKNKDGPPAEAEGEAKKGGFDLADTGLKLLETFQEAKGEESGGGDSDGPQRVFVVNAGEMTGAAAAGQPGRGGRSNRAGRRTRNGPAGGSRAGRRPPRPPTPPIPVPRPPPRPPIPPAPVSTVARLTSAASKISKVGKAIPGGSFLEAGLKAVDTYQNAETTQAKAEGYGEAAGGLAGTMAGAAAGAAIGSVVPIIGTVVGGMIGAYLGSMGGNALGGMAGKSLFGGSDEPVVVKAPEKSPEEKRLETAQRPVVSPMAVTRNGAVPSMPKFGDVARSFESPTAQTPIAALMKPMQKAAEAPAAPTKIEQNTTNSPVFNITVAGDVKDPRALANELMPEIQRRLDEMSQQANRRSMSDEPHL